MPRSLLFANISWNPYSWTTPYSDKRAGHRYAKDHCGHESLNFKFDKDGLDDKDYVYGYFQYTKRPIQLGNDSIVVFVSKNFNDSENYIVGMYGNATLLERNAETTWVGFENNILQSNIRGDRKVSCLLPIFIRCTDYSSKRMTSQAGFVYGERIEAKAILEMAIRSAENEDIDYSEVLEIYRAQFGTRKLPKSDKDLRGKELVSFVKSESIEKLRNMLKSYWPSKVSLVSFNSRSYPRDQYCIEALKRLRGYACQICGKKILKANGEYYIEGAHITPKNQGGNEDYRNILIMCPNHHKLFDYGKKRISSRSDSKIEFYLNEEFFSIDLEI